MSILYITQSISGRKPEVPLPQSNIRKPTFAIPPFITDTGRHTYSENLITSREVQEFGRCFTFFLPEGNIKSRFAAEPAFKGDGFHCEFIHVCFQLQFGFLDSVIMDQVAEICINGAAFQLQSDKQLQSSSCYRL